MFSPFPFVRAFVFSLGGVPEVEGLVQVEGGNFVSEDLLDLLHGVGWHFHFSGLNTEPLPLHGFEKEVLTVVRDGIVVIVRSVDGVRLSLFRVAHGGQACPRVCFALVAVAKGPTHSHVLEEIPVVSPEVQVDMLMPSLILDWRVLHGDTVGTEIVGDLGIADYLVPLAGEAFGLEVSLVGDWLAGSGGEEGVGTVCKCAQGNIFKHESYLKSL